MSEGNRRNAEPLFRSFDGQAYESGACGVCEGVEDARGAVSMARQMLEEVLVPPRIPMESLANLDRLAGITDKIAEYTEEKPVKARSHEELWAELAGDTL